MCVCVWRERETHTHTQAHTHTSAHTHKPPTAIHKRRPGDKTHRPCWHCERERERGRGRQRERGGAGEKDRTREGVRMCVYVCVCVRARACVKRVGRERARAGEGGDGAKESGREAGEEILYYCADIHITYVRY